MSNRTLSPERTILLRAADYMEQHGWCRNMSRNEHGAVCLLGAIMFTDPTNERTARVHLRDFLYTRFGFGSAPHVNDIILKSKAEAVAVLRAAALHGLQNE